MKITLMHHLSVIDVLRTRLISLAPVSLEVTEGPSSLLAYLNSEINGLVDGGAEKTALIGLRNYFEAKGTLPTKGAAVLILLVALETKFPHGRGACLVAPFMDLSKAEDGLKESPTNMTLIGASETNAVYTMVVELELKDDYKPGPFTYYFRPRPVPRVTKGSEGQTMQEFEDGSLPPWTCRGCGPRGGGRLTVAPQPFSELIPDEFTLHISYEGIFDNVRTEWEEFVPLKFGLNSNDESGVVRCRATWKIARGAPPYRRPKQ